MLFCCSKSASKGFDGIFNAFFKMKNVEQNEKTLET